MTLFDCSLSSWKQIAVTSAVHERLFSYMVERAEHQFGDEGKCDARDDCTLADRTVSLRPRLVNLLCGTVECYFMVNAVADARKQRAILLSCCDAST